MVVFNFNERAMTTSRRLLFPVVLALTGVQACKSDGPSATRTDAPVTGDADGGVVGVSRSAFLQAAASCVQTSARAFATAAADLETATAALATTPDEPTAEKARMAFRAALDAWQILEVMHVGPAAPRTQPGGQELRDHVYSWPLVSPCAIESTIVSRGYEDPAFSSSLVNRRGLFALDYLLFYQQDTSRCPSGPPAGWDMLTSDERAARKRAYARAVARDVSQRGSQLAAAWDPAMGNFTAVLASAGPGNKTFATPQAGLNAVVAALSYLDKIKDLKVGGPAGKLACPEVSCPETAYARRSRDNLRANIIGLRRLGEGCGPDFQGTGLVDLLEGVGAVGVAGQLGQRLLAAQAAVDAVPREDLREAMAVDPTSVNNLHAALKAITDLIKVDLETTLDVELPDDVATDND
jgi:uncharacterized protein